MTIISPAPTMMVTLTTSETATMWTTKTIQTNINNSHNRHPYKRNGNHCKYWVQCENDVLQIFLMKTMFLMQRTMVSRSIYLIEISISLSSCLCFLLFYLLVRTVVANKMQAFTACTLLFRHHDIWHTKNSKYEKKTTTTLEQTLKTWDPHKRAEKKLQRKIEKCVDRQKLRQQNVQRCIGDDKHEERQETKWIKWKKRA